MNKKPEQIILPDVNTEIDFNETRAKVKSIKRKVNLRTAASVTEALSSGLVTSVCVGAAALSFKDENSTTSTKVAATSIAVLSTLLCANRVHDAIITIKDHRNLNKIHNVTNKMIDLAEEMTNRHSESESTTDDIEIEDLDANIDSIFNDVNNEPSEEIDNVQQENLYDLSDDVIDQKIGSAIKTAVDNGDIDLEVRDDDIYIKKNNVKVSKRSPLLKKYFHKINKES